MFLQSRDFVAAHPALLPASSIGGDALTRLNDAIAQIEQQDSARLEALDAGHDASAAREALKQWMFDIASASRDAARNGVLEIKPLTVPNRLNDMTLLREADRFLKVGQSFSAQLVQRGLDEHWAEALKKAIDAFATRRENRRAGKRGVTTARTTIASAFTSGNAALRTLDGIVDISLRQQPDLRPAWEQARRVAGAATRKSNEVPVDAPVTNGEGLLEKAS